MKIEIKKLNNLAKIPSKATNGSAGFDLYPAIDSNIILMPGESKLIPTGLAIHIDNTKIAALIMPRSKLGAKKGLVIGNLTGVIDSDYTGEWFISAWNRNFNEPIEITGKEAIAQVLFIELANNIEFVEIAELKQTTRNDGGISKDENTDDKFELSDEPEFVCYECGGITFRRYYSTQTVQCDNCLTKYPLDCANIKHQR